MIKYKIHIVIYFRGGFDVGALSNTVESVFRQSGKYANTILCSVIMPEEIKFDMSAAERQTEIEYIYSNDPKEALRERLLSPTGEYVVIAEAGSVFSENAFSFVYDSFNMVKGNCDAVGVRIESEEGEYARYNGIYAADTKIFHLAERYEIHPVNTVGLFIKGNIAAEKAARQEKGFDENRFLADVLSRRNVFAVCPEAFVTPKIRESEAVSPDAFERKLDELNETARSVITACGYVPLYVQDIFMCAVMKCLNNSTEVAEAYYVPRYDFAAMWDKLRMLLANVDDNVIMKFPTTRFNKLFLLTEKYGRYCGFDLYYNDMKMTFANTAAYDLSSFPVRFDHIVIENGELTVEGVCHIPSCIDLETYSVTAVVNGKQFRTEMIERYSDRYFYDKIYLKEAGFKVKILLAETVYEINIADIVNKNLCVKNVYEFSNICSVGSEIDGEYYYNDGYVVNCGGNTIICRRCDKRALAHWEENLQFAIKMNEPQRADELIEIRDFYWENREKKTKQIWLITDRPDRADDNGEAFFRYMCRRAEENIDLYFVLSSESASYGELSKLGKIVEPFSAEHKKLHLLADYIISSQMAEAVYNPFNEDVKYFRGLFRDPKQVFLQHGVINNEHGGRFFSRYGRDFYGFVVSAREEYNYMLEPKFHYTKREVWLTGLPRWDRLYRDDKKKITIMPTWRKYLTTRTFDEDAGTKIWKVNDNFTETEYFKFYNGVINDSRLLDAADKYGYTICFMPHVIFLKETDKFDRNGRAVIYDYEKSYREIYAESSLVVTDFSSAVFDFAYMRQPVVYCQFDKDEFYRGHSYSRGYFDHERDGFGEVTYDVDGLANVLTEYMADGCKLKPKYRKRIDDFFGFNDRKCCERVYEHIKGSDNTRSSK